MTWSGAGRRRGSPAGHDTAFILLGIAVFVDGAAFGVLFPLLARIQDEHHLQDYALGLMSGAAFFAALGAQFGAARLLDGAKARKVLLAGLLVAAIGAAWFAFAGGLWQLVAARALGGIGYGIVGPASLRQAAVGASGEQRGRRIGLLSSSQMAGITVGPLVGSLLFTAGGLSLPFEALAGMLLVLLIAVAATPSAGAADTTGEPTAGGAEKQPPMRLPIRPVVAILLIGVALQMPSGLYDALWSRLLTDRGAGTLMIGASLSVFGIPFVALAPFGGKLAERRGPLLATAIASIASDFFMASYGFVPIPVVIVLLGIGEACFQAVAFPGGYAAVARVFPENRAATGQGWYSGAGTAAAGGAALVGAPLYAALGPGAVFGGGAVLSALIALASLPMAGRRVRRTGSLAPVGPVQPAEPAPSITEAVP